MPPPRSRWLELVCGIGDFVSSLREAVSGEERYMPVRGSRPIHVVVVVVVVVVIVVLT